MSHYVSDLEGPHHGGHGHGGGWRGGYPFAPTTIVIDSSIPGPCLPYLGHPASQAPAVCRPFLMDYGLAGALGDVSGCGCGKNPQSLGCECNPDQKPCRPPRYHGKCEVGNDRPNHELFTPTYGGPCVRNQPRKYAPARAPLCSGTQVVVRDVNGMRVCRDRNYYADTPSGSNVGRSTGLVPHDEAAATAGLGDLGDSHTFSDVKALAQQLDALTKANPSVVAILQAKGATTPFGQYNLQQILGYYLNPRNSGTGTGDADYTALSAALAAVNAALAGGPAVSASTVVVHSIQDVRALISQIQTVLQGIPSGLTSQANAILARKTQSPGFPAFSLTQVIQYYQKNNQSASTDRDWAALAQGLVDLQALGSGNAPAGTAVSTGAALSCPTGYVLDPTGTYCTAAARAGAAGVLNTLPAPSSGGLPAGLPSATPVAGGYSPGAVQCAPGYVPDSSGTTCVAVGTSLPGNYSVTQPTGPAAIAPTAPVGFLNSRIDLPGWPGAPVPVVGAIAAAVLYLVLRRRSSAA